MVCLHCRFREIVAKLKSMAQGLRPLIKRRPSQITTQASATSSQPSSQAPSYPNSAQLPSIKECTALAEQHALRVPKSTPAAGAAIDAGASTPKTQASADVVAVDASASTPKTQASTEQGTTHADASTFESEASTGQVAGATPPQAIATANHVAPDTAAAGESDAGQQNAGKTAGQAAASSQASTEQQGTQEGTEKPSGDKSQKDTYVSPFEQAQEPAAASTQGLSPFANIS